MVLHHGRLEVLADKALGRDRNTQLPPWVVVVARLALGVAEGRHAAQGGEEVQESDVGAVNGVVRHLVAPRAQQLARLFAQQVRLNAKVFRPVDSAAEVIPREAAFHEPIALALVTVHHAALVVLRERAGAFFQHFRGRVAPAGEAAGVFVVGQEITGGFEPVGQRQQQVGDVVGQVHVRHVELHAHHPQDERGRHLWAGHPIPAAGRRARPGSSGGCDVAATTSTYRLASRSDV